MRLRTIFFPKVCISFHLNQDIVLPYLRPSPKYSKEISQRLASHSTMARCICQLIIYAYDPRGRIPPFPVKAHTNRSVSVSWAFSDFKAATWSSVHMFRFYQVDVQVSAGASFTLRLFRQRYWLLSATLVNL